MFRDIGFMQRLQKLNPCHQSIYPFLGLLFFWDRARLFPLLCSKVLQLLSFMAARFPSLKVPPKLHHQVQLGLSESMSIYEPIFVTRVLWLAKLGHMLTLGPREYGQSHANHWPETSGESSPQKKSVTRGFKGTDGGQAKPTNINCSRCIHYGGKLVLRKPNQLWFITFEDATDVRNPSMANFKLPTALTTASKIPKYLTVCSHKPVRTGFSAALHPSKEEEKNPCREEVFIRGKGFLNPLYTWYFIK